MRTLREDNIYQDDTSVGINELLKENKKVISFLGASQSGTTFIINNIARIMARRDISVAILDMTSNKDSYYIYTQNQESIRANIKDCFKNLSEGKFIGIEIEKNLTIYTDLPNEKEYSVKVEKILETLLKKHQIVLIDTDFSTDFDYFSYSQQVYLIQTMNVLTIQQLTEFLSKLKSQNVIDDDKIRIILNKYMEIDGITIKQLIGGLAFYNDPSMSYMQQIFEKNGARYTTISYNQHAYERYLQDIAKYQISIDDNSSEFRNELERLTDDVIRG